MIAATATTTIPMIAAIAFFRSVCSAGMTASASVSPLTCIVILITRTIPKIAAITITTIAAIGDRMVGGNDDGSVRNVVTRSGVVAIVSAKVSCPDGVVVADCVVGELAMVLEWHNLYCPPPRLESADVDGGGAVIVKPSMVLPIGLHRGVSSLSVFTVGSSEPRSSRSPASVILAMVTCPLSHRLSVWNATIRTVPV
jgi:hypothetical protein